MAMIIKMPPRPLRIIIAAVFLIFITFILFKSDWVSINDLTPPPPPPERQHDPAPTKPETTETETSGCHFHEASLVCLVGTTEYVVKSSATPTTDAEPPSFTGCHKHGSDLFCFGPDGDEVQLVLASDTNPTGSEEHPDERHCHFHAGVEHCVGPEPSTPGESDEDRCGRVQRDYNVPLRLVLLVIILATSAIGVFGPIFLSVYLPPKFNIVLALLKQFGTGVVISTAFVHLYTHASLMFSNPCIGDIGYEGVASAILMAGLFVSFFIEYAAHRIADLYMPAKDATEGNAALSRQMINISVMEAGILFHSLLIGLTLVVTGDAFFITLSIVIIFHQAFEGIALGSCIAALGHASNLQLSVHSHHHHFPPAEESGLEDDDSLATASPVPLRKKLLLASAFALVTPAGMAMGICVLNSFNGNDSATIWAIGSLDAFSAGILVWVGIVEMWAGDWMLGGSMAHSRPVVAALGLVALVSGMALMSFLGKWA